MQKWNSGDDPNRKVIREFSYELDGFTYTQTDWSDNITNVRVQRTISDDSTFVKGTRVIVIARRTE